MAAGKRRKRSKGDIHSRLNTFMRENKLTPGILAAEAGISRQHLLRIRRKDANPTVMVAMRVRDACGRLLKRYVRIAEVFEVE